MRGHPISQILERQQQRTAQTQLARVVAILTAGAYDVYTFDKGAIVQAEAGQPNMRFKVGDTVLLAKPEGSGTIKGPGYIIVGLPPRQYRNNITTLTQKLSETRKSSGVTKVLPHPLVLGPDEQGTIEVWGDNFSSETEITGDAGDWFFYAPALIESANKLTLYVQAESNLTHSHTYGLDIGQSRVSSAIQTRHAASGLWVGSLHQQLVGYDASLVLPTPAATDGAVGGVFEGPGVNLVLGLTGQPTIDLYNRATRVVREVDFNFGASGLLIWYEETQWFYEEAAGRIWGGLFNFSGIAPIHSLGALDEGALDAGLVAQVALTARPYGLCFCEELGTVWVAVQGGLFGTRLQLVDLATLAVTSSLTDATGQPYRGCYNHVVGAGGRMFWGLQIPAVVEARNPVTGALLYSRVLLGYTNVNQVKCVAIAQDQYPGGVYDADGPLYVVSESTQSGATGYYLHKLDPADLTDIVPPLYVAAERNVRGLAIGPAHVYLSTGATGGGLAHLSLHDKTTLAAVTTVQHPEYSSGYGWGGLLWK